MTGAAPTAGAEEDYEGPDAGMAAERTDLAWSRSGLAIGACGVIVLKGLPEVTGNPGAPLARWRDLAPAAYGTAGVGLAGLLLIFLRAA